LCLNGQTYALLIDSSYLTVVQIYLKIQQGFKRYMADTKYSHTMFNLELWPWSWRSTLAKHTHCSSTHHTWHLCSVIWKSQIGLKDVERTRKTVVQWLNINWTDVQKKNVVNNVDMSSLRALWQNGSYKN